MTLPTIHLGGSSPWALNDDYVFALTAVRDARDAIRRIDFNARDYYVQGAGAWEAAVAERQAQMQALDGLIHYLEEHLTHIYDVIDRK